MNTLNCPNRCNHGWIIDPYNHTRRLCEHCKKEREKEVTDGDVIEKLKLPLSFMNSIFEPSSVFPEYMIKNLEEQSVNDVCEKMQELINTVITGRLPEYSMLFNLGAKVLEENFLNPLILKGYIAGLKVAPILDIVTLMRLRLNYENGIDATDDDYTFGDYLTCDLCVVNIDAGTTKHGVLSAKGLMQLRARHGKPTIFVTHLWGSLISQLYHDDNEVHSLNLATLISVEYKEKEQQVREAAQASTVVGRRHGAISKKEYERMRSAQNLGVS